MKIPKEIRIAGTDYKTEYVENLNNGSNVCYGHCHSEQRKIELNGTLNIDHQHRCVTYIHEVLHAIIEHYRVDIGSADVEKLIIGFSNGLYQVLQDNAGRLFDLKEPIAPEEKTESER